MGLEIKLVIGGREWGKAGDWGLGLKDFTTRVLHILYFSTIKGRRERSSSIVERVGIALYFDQLHADGSLVSRRSWPIFGDVQNL